MVPYKMAIMVILRDYIPIKYKDWIMKDNTGAIPMMTKELCYQKMKDNFEMSKGSYSM